MKTTDFHPDDLMDAIEALSNVRARFEDMYVEMDVHAALLDILKEAVDYLEWKRNKDDGLMGSEEEALALRAWHHGRVL